MHHFKSSIYSHLFYFLKVKIQISARVLTPQPPGISYDWTLPVPGLRLAPMKWIWWNGPSEAWDASLKIIDGFYVAWDTETGPLWHKIGLSGPTWFFSGTMIKVLSSPEFGENFNLLSASLLSLHIAWKAERWRRPPGSVGWRPTATGSRSSLLPRLLCK